ncbi:MAG: carbohydrate ABC transporter permease [Treponema sp.]|jgi:putative aldouronate transport system permease protein|nr:carbohydrate ABC transporter permease [Treponema sp.]
MASQQQTNERALAKLRQAQFAAPGKKKGGISEFTQIRPATNAFFHVLLFAFAASCILPVLLIISISFSDELTVAKRGYKFIPEVFTLESYRYVFLQGSMIARALGMSILVTGLGTLFTLALTTTMGYVLSRREYRLHNIYHWLVFIPMIIGGGLVASYVINTQVFHLRNTIWVLFVPGAVSSFNVIICRTFFRSNVPDAVIDSAMIDGASQFTIYFRLVLPLSLPVLATIGLFASFGLWNDWFTALLYIQDMRLYTLQALLNKLLEDINNLVKNAELVGVSSLEMLLKLPKEGARMAIAALVVLPIACAYPFFQRYFISGLTIGSVKE